MLALRLTIWLALAAYVAALGLRGWDRERWRSSARWRWSRGLWTAACIAYLCHVAAAFHLVHGWSHEQAFQHVEEGSGFGPGIYITYAFTLAWVADMLAWWVWPAWYLRRPAWFDGCFHAFLLFIIFNGAVVFAEGPSRWIGIVLLTGLAAAWWRGMLPRARL